MPKIAPRLYKMAERAGVKAELRTAYDDDLKPIGVRARIKSH